MFGFVKKIISKLSFKFFTSIFPFGPDRATFFSENYATFALEGYQRNVYVYKSIQEISTTIASIPWILKDKRTDKEIDSHALLDLLAMPNPLMSGQAFFQWMMSYFLIGGKEFILSIGPLSDGSGAPTELWPMQPDSVKIIKGNSRMPIAGFGFKKKDGTVETLPEGSVLYLRTFNPLDPLDGLSPIMVAAMSITQGNESKRWNVSLLQNHARPPGAFIAKGTFGPGVKDRIREEMTEKWTGADNAGKPLMLEGGMEWTQFGLNASDMDWLEGQKISAREIALVYGVPPELIGDVSNKTYSNYKEARRAFYEDTIIPTMEWLKGELNRWLVPKFDDNLELDFDTDQMPAMQEDRDLLFKRLNEAQFLSVNEKREMAGFEPDRAGDVILVPLNLVPLSFATEGGSGHEDEDDDDDKKPKKAAKQTEVQTVVLNKEQFPTLANARKWAKDNDFKTSKVDETDDSWRFRQFPPGRCKDDSFRTIKLAKGVSGVICQPKEGRSFDPETDEKAFNLKTRARKIRFWKQFDRRRIMFFKRAEGLFSRQLRADIRAATRAVEKSDSVGSLNEAADKAIKDNFDDWLRLFSRLYQAVGDDFATDIFRQIKSATDAPEWKGVHLEAKQTEAQLRDIWLEEIQAWLDGNGTIRVLGIQDTTTREVLNVISEGVGEGLSIPKISRAIAQQAGITVGPRSRLIARTEVISASNLGSHAAANAVELPLKKEWIATPDERVRDAHADADGQIVPSMDDAFSVDGEQLLFPGDTSLGATGANIFNCRCVTGYIPVDSADNVPAAT